MLGTGLMGNGVRGEVSTRVRVPSGGDRREPQRRRMQLLTILFTINITTLGLKYILYVLIPWNIL